MSSSRLPLLAFIAAFPVHAQQAPAIERVQITADANTLRRNETAAKTIINRAEINRYGDVSVLDVVRRLPGVTVDGASIRMRGLGAGYTQVLINGERAPAGFALDSLSPDMIERIEVARAATADVSTQAIAGTVNIVLRKTVDRAAREMKASLGAGAGQLSPGASMTLAGKTDTLSYTGGANLAITNRDSEATAAQDTRNSVGALTRRHTAQEEYYNESASLNLNARLNWALASGDTVSWHSFVNRSRSKGTNAEHTTTVMGPPHPFPSLDGDYGFVNADARSDISWSAKLAAGARLDTKAGVTMSSSRRFLHRVGGDPAQTPLLETLYETDSGDKAVSWSGKYTKPVGAGHTLAAGWDTGHTRYSEAEEQRDTSRSPLTPFNFDNRFKASITRLAVYAQDEWEVSPAWSLYLGTRWEQIDTDTRGPGLTPSSSHSGVLSPLLQSLWKIPGAKGSQLRVGLSKTYKAPDVRRLVPNHFYTSLNRELSPDHVGNPDLKPELALGLDAAYEYYWAQGALFSVSATSRSIDDLIQNVITFEDGRYVSRGANQGTAEVRALEMELKFPLTAMMKNAPSLDLRASASRNWSKVDSIPGPDNRLDRQPRWSANFGADYKKGAFSLGGNLALVGAASTRRSAFETRYVSARRELEAYGLYKVNAKEQLRVTMRNLLRTDSASSARYADANGSVETLDQSEGLIGWRVQYEVKF